MSGNNIGPNADDKAATRIGEARSVLEALGFPRAQLNDRSALTLLAMLDLRPGMPWSGAQRPLKGITPIMDWCREHYGREYAPNTRETFRRQTMHQFVEAALVVANPDRPDRPINSPQWCYQIEPEALALLRTFGTRQWEENLATYGEMRTGLRRRYAKQRDLNMVPVSIAQDVEISISSGRHSTLIKAIMEEFGPATPQAAK